MSCVDICGIKRRSHRSGPLFSILGIQDNGFLGEEDSLIMILNGVGHPPTKSMEEHSDGVTEIDGVVLVMI